MNDSLYRFLAEHCRTHDVRSYLEIGTREGGSLAIVLQAAAHLEVVYCADTWGGEYGGSNRGGHAHIDTLLASCLYTGEVRYLDGDSKVTLPEVARTFDLILVDGDHSYEGGMADLLNSWALLKPGGTIVFHDVTHPAHPDLLRCWEQFVSYVRPAIQAEHVIVEPYGLGVATRAK